MRIGLVLVGALSMFGCKAKEVPAPPFVPTPAADEPADPAATQPTGTLPRRRPDPVDLSPAPAANTMNGDPDGPQQAAFDAVQVDGQRKVQACLDAMPATTPLTNGQARIAVKFSVGNDGKPKDVAITTDLPAEPSACAKAAIEGLAFAPFKGPVVSNSFSLNYSRAVAPAAPKP